MKDARGFSGKRDRENSHAFPLYIVCAMGINGSLQSITWMMKDVYETCVQGHVVQRAFLNRSVCCTIFLPYKWQFPTLQVHAESIILLGKHFHPFVLMRHAAH